MRGDYVKEKTQKNDYISERLSNAKGAIQFNMTNDYMFRAVLQSNKKVLRGFLCSLLHLNAADIKSVEITNPIKLGSAIDNKTFILDIEVLLNNNRKVNLEMQVVNQHNWQERSLLYLCRSFDSLNKGQEYVEVMPTIHISIVAFDPFPDFPEFYARYRMMNKKNFNIYSSKFALNVLSLVHTDISTDEDRNWKLDKWAKLFTSKSWEEMHMLTEKDSDFIALSEEILKNNYDETIRQQCLMREARENEEKYVAQMEKDIKKLNSENSKLNSRVTKLSSEIADLQKLLADNNIEIPDK